MRQSFFDWVRCVISRAMMPPRDVPMSVSLEVMLFWVMIFCAREVRVNVAGIFG